MAISLKIDGVAKAFKGNAVLKGIILEARGSDIIGLIGKSGCGKSTLLKILVGYQAADSGTVYINGQKASKDRMALRRMVGYTTQENSFYENLSVLENMRYYAALYQVPSRERRQRIRELLEKVGLWEHRKTMAGRISGGMKRRLDFAISLAHGPSVLILDEPTAGLDPLLIDQFWRIVHDVVKKEDKIVIMSSHILPEIEKYCTKAAVIKDGKIAKVLSRRQVKNLEEKFRKIVK